MAKDTFSTHVSVSPGLCELQVQDGRMPLDLDESRAMDTDMRLYVVRGGWRAHLVSTYYT